MIPRESHNLTQDKQLIDRLWYKFFSNLPTQSDAVADIATADATDLASVITLANANKAKINELLQKLRTAGILES
jgi:2-oxoglutarate dehydrogenase complex dehydrogenase (E1) component-like enzyme